jgi:hypothetical protein
LEIERLAREAKYRQDVENMVYGAHPDTTHVLVSRLTTPTETAATER